MTSLAEVGTWLQARLPGLIDEYRIPGLAVAVSVGDDVIDHAAGVLSTATGVEATTDSVFQIGSVTKLWTATLSMQLVDEGRLELDAPVRRYLSGFRVADEAASAAVTVRQLLTHTAGFAGDIFLDTGRNDDCVERYVDSLGDVEQVFAPGAMFAYNNAAFTVLGRIIEVLHGKPFAACLREHLIEPLALTHAPIGADEAILFRAAVGHVTAGPGEPEQPAPVWNLVPAHVPAGSLLAMSARDLIGFARMQLRDGVGPDGSAVVSPAAVAGRWRSWATTARAARSICTAAGSAGAPRLDPEAAGGVPAGGGAVTARQTLFFLLDLALIISLARLMGALARRLRQPAVLGEILAGLLLGPTLFGDGFTSTVFPADVVPLLQAPASLGVALFMFLMGLELEPSRMRGHGRVAVAVTLVSTALPFVLGFGAAYLLSGRPPGTRPLDFALYLGAAMSVTAFPVLARILADRGMLGSRIGSLALTCAAGADVLAWSLLAVVLAVGHREGDSPLLLLALPAYVAVMVLAVRPLLRRLPAGPGATAALLAGALLSGAATQAMGLHFLFGAFLFGAVVPRERSDWLRDRLSTVISTVLLPVFLVVAGLAVDLRGLGGAGVGDLLLILAVAIVGKAGGTFVAARAGRMPAREAATLGVLMNTRGLTELIVLSIGLQAGLLDVRLYSILVAMAILTTGMAGPLLRLTDRPLAAPHVTLPA